MDDRACFQEAEAELPAAFFLLGYRKRDKNAGMVYLDSPFTADRNPLFYPHEESIFNRSGVDTHPFDKPFGFELGSNRRTAGVCQADNEQKQKSCCHTVGSFLGGRWAFEMKNQTAKNQYDNK
jgi:hypothetical protein